MKETPKKSDEDDDRDDSDRDKPAENGCNECGERIIRRGFYHPWEHIGEGPYDHEPSPVGG